MQFTHRLCFTKQPTSGQITLPWYFLNYPDIFVLKLKIHLCNDAFSLTSLGSSNKFNCLHIYLLLRSADTTYCSVGQTIVILISPLMAQIRFTLLLNYFLIS